jgi:hypothetical protein
MAWSTVVLFTNGTPVGTPPVDTSDDLATLEPRLTYDIGYRYNDPSFSAGQVSLNYSTLHTVVKSKMRQDLMTRFEVFQKRLTESFEDESLEIVDYIADYTVLNRLAILYALWTIFNGQNYSQDDVYFRKAKQYKAMYEEEFATVVKFVKFNDTYYTSTGLKNDGIARFSW